MRRARRNSRARGDSRTPVRNPRESRVEKARAPTWMRIFGSGSGDRTFHVT